MKKRTEEEQAARLKAIEEKWAPRGEKAGEVTRELFNRGKKAASNVLGEAAKAAALVQQKVTDGVHRVMGSEEYKKKALEVNARLTVALSSLEDSIVRRDEEIVRLRARVAELEGSSNG